MTRLYDMYGQDIEARSADRKGFTGKPIGSVEYMTVL